MVKGPGLIPEGATRKPHSSGLFQQAPGKPLVHAASHSFRSGGPPGKLDSDAPISGAPQGSVPYHAPPDYPHAQMPSPPAGPSRAASTGAGAGADAGADASEPSASYRGRDYNEPRPSHAAAASIPDVSYRERASAEPRPSRRALTGTGAETSAPASFSERVRRHSG